MTTTCSLCKSSKCNIKRKAIDHAFVECDSCGFAFTDPLLADKHSTVDGYDAVRTEDGYREALQQDHDKRKQLAVSIAAQRIEIYKKYIGRKPKSILDVGCGDGALFFGFSQFDVEWMGIDINPELATFAASKGIPLTRTDLNSFEPRIRYDVIYASQVLEHVLTPEAFLRKAKSLLADDGILHVDVPNHDSLTATVRKIFPGNNYGMLQPPFHLMAYRKRTLKYLLHKCGFRTDLLRAVANDHATFGQIRTDKTILKSAFYRASELLGRGSVLMAIAHRQR